MPVWGCGRMKRFVLPFLPADFPGILSFTTRSTATLSQFMRTDSKCKVVVTHASMYFGRMLLVVYTHMVLLPAHTRSTCQPAGPPRRGSTNLVELRLMREG